MNIFKANSSAKSGALLPRRTVADVSQHLYRLYEEIYIFNRRMANMAIALGGSYPIPTADSRDAPEDICGRMFYDIDLLSAAMTEMAHHVSQLEIITGLRPLEEPAAPEVENPGPKLYATDPPDAL